MAETDYDPEDLISAVYEQPALWDQTSKHYRNRVLVEKCWITVAGQLKLPEDKVEHVKKKWKALRDTFRRELLKIPQARSGDAADQDNYVTWKHFMSMSFLRDQMRPRKMSGNLQVANKENQQEESEGDDERYEVEALDDSSGDFEVPNPPVAELTYASNGISAPPVKKLKKSKDSIAARLVDIENKKLELLEKRAAQNERDEDEAFLESLLPHLRKLNPEQKLRCRIQMQNVVLKHAYTREGNDADDDDDA